MTDKKVVLKELKDLLVAHFGEDINNVILFGSQVTGKTHEDSDFDVLIILNRDFDWDYQRHRLSTSQNFCHCDPQARLA